MRWFAPAAFARLLAPEKTNSQRVVFTGVRETYGPSRTVRVSGGTSKTILPNPTVGLANMATYTVGPMPGDSKRWKVEKDGYQVSKHNSKSNAKQRARKEAGPTDSITVKRSDGQFQKRLRG